MGSTVIVDNTLIYLVANENDELFVLPRDKYEPELRTQLPKLSRLKTSVVSIPDELGLEYLELTPWGGYPLKDQKKYQTLEESARNILVGGVKNIPNIYRKAKEEFANAEALWIDPKYVINTDYFNPARFGAQQLINFLEAFAWVSKNTSVECISVGDDRDFDFKVYEKSAFSIFGKHGDLLHHFRWSEFEFVEVTNLVNFSIKTIDGSWGAAMGRKGFRKKQ
jgi:hypothetical protein